MCCRLLDHVIGKGHHRGWDREAERLSRFEIDDQLQFGLHLDRQIGRFSAVQNLRRKRGDTPPLIGYVKSVAHQACGFNMHAEPENGWKPRSECQCCNPIGITAEQILKHQYGVYLLAGEGMKGRIDLSEIVEPGGNQSNRSRGGVGLNKARAGRIGGIACVEQHPNSRRLGDDLQQQVELLRCQLIYAGKQSGDVAPGRARLATKLKPTGSAINTPMIGILLVTRLAARVRGVS